MVSNVEQGSSTLQTRRSLGTLAREAAAILVVLAGLLGGSQMTSASEGKFVNLSTRTLVKTGEEVMIGGFIIEDGPLQVLIQAVGPELANAGISNVLADPVITVTNTTDPDPANYMELMVNDNWEDSQGQLVSDLWGGSPPMTSGSLSSAAVLTLDPGNYTAKVEGRFGTTGVALVEVYGINSTATDGRLVNLSTRALVERGEEVMIGGFIIKDGFQQFLIQALGPELGNDGISNVLADPVITVTNTTDPDPAKHKEVMVNDNWEDGQGHLVSDFWGGSPPLTAGSLSSAAVLVLGPGNYTAKVAGRRVTAGVAFVEVYGIDSPGLENPDFLGLTSLYIAANGANWANTINWLTDAPLSDWYGVTTDNAGRVIGLDLGENNLLGTIPGELGYLSNLQNLRLAHNRLSGPIPPELGNLANLKSLDLYFNRLSGQIPIEELGNLANLEWLSLGINQLSGPIPPQLDKLANLRYLDLRGNQLSGPIPPELVNLANLRELDLRENRLSGPIPPELGNLTNLVSLNLSRNQLSGPIPSELSDLANLSLLSLKRNQLSGCVPGGLRDLKENDFSELGLPFCDDLKVPDLVVLSPSVSDNGPRRVSSFTMSATVRNQGGRESSATTLRYYRSEDASITPSDREVGTEAVGILPASSTSDQSIELTAPTMAGMYFYGACVDVVPNEYDTTNNCSSSVQVVVE